MNIKILTIFLLISNIGYSQHFTIRDLSNLYSLDYTSLESVLYKKGFFYADSKKRKTDESTTTVISFLTKDGNFMITKEIIYSPNIKTTETSFEYHFQEVELLEGFKSYLRENKFSEYLAVPTDTGFYTGYDNDKFEDIKNIQFGAHIVRKNKNYKMKYVVGVSFMTVPNGYK